MSPKSTALVNKVARLHDPESRALDDLPGLVRELEGHLEDLEGRLGDVATAWETVKAIEPAWRRNAALGSLDERLRKALDALLPETPKKEKSDG